MDSGENSPLPLVTPGEPEDTIVLVTREDPERLVFDKSSQSALAKKDRKHSSILTLTSHPGKALGVPQTRMETAGIWSYKPLLLVRTEDTECVNDRRRVSGGKIGGTTKQQKQPQQPKQQPWSFDGNFLSTTLQDGKEEREFVLDIWGWHIEERRRVAVVCGPDESVTREPFTQTDEKGKPNRRYFVLNDDGSVSPQDKPELFLGRRGIEHPDELLIEAVYLHNSDKVRQLMGEGADVNGCFWPIKENRMFNGFCALSQACYIGDLKMAKLLIEEYNAMLEPPSVSRSPLILACQEGHKHIVTYLLDNGADHAKEDSRCDTPLCRSTKASHKECMIVLLDRCKNDMVRAIEKAIVNRQLESLETLLDHKAYLDLDDKDREKVLRDAIRHATDNDLPFVTTILRMRGDLQEIDAVKKIDLTFGGTPTMNVLIRAYAELSTKELSTCVTRACIKYSSSNKNRKHSHNPLLSCIYLAQEAKKQWTLVRRFDTTSADSFFKLFTQLQLGAAALLHEIHQDTTVIEGGNQLVVTISKKDKLNNFLKTQSSEKAFKIAYQIQARTFFSEPLLQGYINRNWYGGLINEFFFEPHSSQMIRFLQIIAFLILLTVQLPLLPLIGYLPPRLHEYLLRLEYPDPKTEYSSINGIDNEHLDDMCHDSFHDHYDDRITTSISPMNPKRIVRSIFHKKSRKLFLLQVPCIMFIFQLSIDLAFAIIFTLINEDWLYSTEELKLFLLLFMVGSSLTSEVVDMSKKGLTTYFRVNPFNSFDLPGLISATLALFIRLALPNNSSGLIATNIFLSVASICLWLRMLRALTLFPAIGPLTLMVFEMIIDICKWLLLAVFFVLAFTSGVSKFNLSGGAECSNANIMSPLIFVRQLIAGDDTLFSCMDKETPFGIIIIYISFLLGNVLLVNMLIAIMAETFSSVWEAQETNSVFLRAVLCIDMIEQRCEPFPSLSGPHSIYLVASYIFRKCTKTCLEEKERKSFEEEHSESSYDFNETRKIELTSRISEYMKDKQDDSSDENRWRIGLENKVASLEKELSREMKERIGETEKRMVERMDGMEKRMENRMEGIEKTLGDLVSLLTKTDPSQNKVPIPSNESSLSFDSDEITI